MVCAKVRHENIPHKMPPSRARTHQNALPERMQNTGVESSSENAHAWKRTQNIPVDKQEHLEKKSVTVVKLVFEVDSVLPLQLRRQLL